MRSDETLEDVTSRPVGEPALTSQRQAAGIAEQIIEDLRGTAEALLDEQKRRASETVHGIAAALQRTAETLHHENVALAPYADQAAGRVAALAARIRDERWRDLAAEAEAVAHRQPALFVIGAIAAGFIVGRFMTASADERDDVKTTSDPSAHAEPGEGILD
jgi:hypothetical protein